MNSTKDNYYLDYVIEEGTYYYVIVAENEIRKSAFSNCQYVVVDFAELDAPVLAPITPNPSDTGSVFLDWNDITDITHYYVYRSNTFIWSVEGLTPIITVVGSDFTDTLPAEDYYFYSVVATNGVINSTFSNCEFVSYGLPEIVPLQAPDIAQLLPNPSEVSTIQLDWNDIDGAIIYYIFRSNNYIRSVNNLTPLATSVVSDYTDSLPSEDYYFYVIVATDGVTNSTPSNCEYVKYELPEPILLQAPDLAIVIPNPSDISNIFLDWDDIDGATEYFIYRSNSYIWSVDSMTPLITVVDSDYIDSLPSEDYYFYVIVATDGVTNSTLSNCEYVEYKLPTLFEYLFPIGLTISLACIVTSAIFLRRRKGKN